MTDNNNTHMSPRMRSYYSMTPEARSEMNARYNKRRHDVHLLPRVRSILRLAKEVTPGSYLARYAVVATLAHAHRDWKLAHALGYGKARDALVKLAGGPEHLEWLEDKITLEVAA